MFAGKLPGCDKWHPDKLPNIVRHRYRSSRGYFSFRRRCLTCDRIRKKSYNKKTASPRVREPYGVIPLTWKPPETITNG